VQARRHENCSRFTGKAKAEKRQRKEEEAEEEKSFLLFLLSRWKILWYRL
jgi:hypothetical protein